MSEMLPAPEQLPERRVRRPGRPWVAGVSGAVGRRTGIPAWVIRALFVILTFMNGFGSLLYVGLWIALPRADRRPQREARRRVRRPSNGEPARTRGSRRAVWRPIILAVIGGVALLIVLDGIGDSLPWLAVLLGGAGVVLVWLQSRPGSEQMLERRSWLTPLLSRERTWVIARTVVGLILILWGIGIIFAEEAAFVPQALAMATMLLGGFGLVLAPWLYRAREAVTSAREDEVRARAHAEMAAHLHDSVLQTLALIQKRSDDPAAVQTLARRQERELRSWLYPREGQRAETAGIQLRSGLEAACARVESEHDIPVELIVVGDADLETSAIIDAATEAATNAAKHSGAPKIDVYAEVTDAIEVFVRDRGRGFDPAQVPDDRHGIRDSLHQRMERHGGSVRIRTSPGDGAEVQLRLPQPAPVDND